MITTVPQGTALTVLGRNALNTWILVQLPDGTQGWVTRTLTDFTGTVDQVDAPALGIGGAAGAGSGGTAGVGAGAAVTATTGITATAGVTGTTGVTATGIQGTIPGNSTAFDSANAGEPLSNL